MPFYESRVERLLNKLERRLGGYAIPHLTLLIIIGQVTCYAAIKLQLLSMQDMVLVPQLVMHGEVWRLATFLFMPVSTNEFILFFALYIFFLMGGSLEHEWGDFKYNIYFLIGYVMTVLMAFTMYQMPATHHYIGESVFLAFALLFPDFELYLMFLIPVKVKYLALLTWIMYGISFIFGPIQAKLLIVAACLNYFIFFGEMIFHNMKTARRRMAFDAQQIKSRDANEAFHRCAVCGMTEKDNPKMDFRVCLECTDGKEYCKKHLKNHDHS